MSLKPLVLIAAIAFPAPALAQDWDYTATLYGWFPGVTTALETPQGELESEVDFEEILETLDIAALGAFEARNGRLSLIGDLQFFDISAEEEAPFGTLFSRAEVDSRITLVSAYATYAVVDQPNMRVDIGGGLRYYDASIDTFLEGAAAPDTLYSDDGSWMDVLVAARVNRSFGQHWYGVAYADVGGFGIGDSSDLSWQAFVGAGYRFNQTWSVVGGYRHLSIDRAFERTDITSEISGALLGVQASF